MKRGRPLSLNARRESELVFAITRAGSLTRLAYLCGYSVSVVCQWRRVPEEMVLRLAVALGVSCQALRSDFYAKPAGTEEWRLPELPVEPNPRDARVVEIYKRLGTLQAAGDELGCTRERVRQIICRYERDTGEHVTRIRGFRNEVVRSEDPLP
jgi:hypothetical protein